MEDVLVEDLGGMGNPGKSQKCGGAGGGGKGGIGINCACHTADCWCN